MKSDSPRIALYIRVSKTEQKFDSQESELLSYCERRGWKRPFLIYREKVSGAESSRTELDRLMQDARKNRFDILATYKMDRLGRSMKHLTQIFSELKNLRIPLVCCSQGIDTTDGGPAGEMQMNILGAFAQFERGLISERTIAGLHSARARGVRLGRPAFGSKVRTEILALRKPDGKGRQFSYDEIAEKTGKSVGYVWKVINPPSQKGPLKKEGGSRRKGKPQKMTV